MDQRSLEVNHTVNSILDCSIVIPVYFNEGSLGKVVTSIKSEVIARNPNLRFEIIFVDDGSGDGSFDELIRLRKEYPKIIKVIKLTRNFGQVNALMAGLSYARGKCIVKMAADGQDPPALINDMLEAHFKEHFEIVLAVRHGRDESWYRILTSKLFYGMIRKLSFPNMPLGGFDYTLLSRKALDVLLRNREAYPFVQGQVLYMGFKMKLLKYRRLKRISGQSRWTFGKKLTYLIDGVMGYSFFPIRLISGVGVVVASLGLIYAVVIFISKLFGGISIKGWTPLMIVILVMGGLQIFMLGIIGEYLWRTLAQVRNRDPYIIEAIYDDENG
jgi:dolichol-phosphate mannosyltransferase